MKRKDAYVFAVAGTGGAISKEIVETLEEKELPVSELILLAEDPSSVEKLQYKNKGARIERLTKGAFADVDVVLFAEDCEDCGVYARHAARAGAVAIANAGVFRDDVTIPIVVPEVNPEAIERHPGIIANPGSMSIGLSLALKPIHKAVGIRRISVTALEAVSAAGKKAMDELAGQTVSLLNFRDVEHTVYPYQIAFNCLPHIGAFLGDGATQEERDLAHETSRLLGDETIHVEATAVVVPVFRSHSASVCVDTEQPLSPDEARALMAGSRRIVVFDDPEKHLYPTPIDAAGKDEVYVGRIRQGAQASNVLNLWVVHDNLHCMAVNAVQIAEHLIR